jgi:hypothetical protein
VGHHIPSAGFGKGEDVRILLEGRGEKVDEAYFQYLSVILIDFEAMGWVWIIEMTMQQISTKMDTNVVKVVELTIVACFVMLLDYLIVYLPLGLTTAPSCQLEFHHRLCQPGVARATAQLNWRLCSMVTDSGALPFQPYSGGSFQP